MDFLHSLIHELMSSSNDINEWSGPLPAVPHPVPLFWSLPGPDGGGGASWAVLRSALWANGSFFPTDSPPWKRAWSPPSKLSAFGAWNVTIDRGDPQSFVPGWPLVRGWRRDQCFSASLVRVFLRHWLSVCETGPHCVVVRWA